MSTMNKTLLTIDDIAERSSVSRTVVKQWMRQGCPVIRFNPRLVRIPVEEFDAWLKAKIEGGVIPRSGQSSDSSKMEVVERTVFNS